jgi:hypothetical protein
MSSYCYMILDLDPLRLELEYRAERGRNLSLLGSLKDLTHCGQGFGYQSRNDFGSLLVHG